MNSLRLDLTDRQEFSKAKRVLFLAFSVCFLFLGSFGLYYKIIAHKEVFTSILFLFLSIGYLLQGLNIKLFKVKEFINIDEEQLSFKLSMFRKASTIIWDEVHKVEIKKSAILVYLQNEKPVKIGLSLVSFKNVTNIKRVIHTLAKSKDIPVNV
ncbi:MAG TPA: hypothetical protein DCQ31_04840 [Bacteroidales bacterium]|nr:hypothetical protein [Bacteroidales bacterium]